MACSSSTPAAWWFTIAVLFFVVAAASAGWISDDPNPIRMVPDELREVEAEVVRVVGRTRHALSFARFAVRHGKRYESPEELKMRFEVFSENKRLIRSTNRKRLSYTLAVNHFADWTWEEFKRHRLGAAQNCSATLKGNHKLTEAVLPETQDWRKEGIVSPVKDQGSCGSCWTFRFF